MQSEVEGRQIGDMELRQVWTKCMPRKMRPGLEMSTNDTPHDELADFTSNCLRNLREEENRTSQITKEKAKRTLSLTMDKIAKML
ncbi:unnamed protein product [Mesocestoides corti]|nr:unnamed protein product [Mesocestoides corti]